MSEWMPIETAPRGEHLLYFPNVFVRGRPSLIAMTKVGLYPVTYPRQPTHWMPLPPPPKNAKTEKEANK